MDVGVVGGAGGGEFKLGVTVEEGWLLINIYYGYIFSKV
jgi:hypothetical protein